MRKPCPNHPDDGDVTWYSVTFAPRYPGDQQQTAELAVCWLCIKVRPLAREQVEADNPLRREVRPRRGSD